MNAKTLLAGTSITLALTAAAATPAHAVLTTFATFSALTTDNFYFKNAATNGKSANATYYSIATPGSTTPGTVNVKFSFINEGALLDTAVSGVTAKFTLSGTATNAPAILAAGYDIQTLLGGTFSLKTTAPITVGRTTFAAGSNLLSATFGKAGIVGKNTDGSFGADNVSPDTLVYTSDFLSFRNGSGVDASLALTSVTPSFAIVTPGTYALKTFKGDASGNFSANPVPHVIPVVPEPASWALMVVGFGLAGATMRRRTRIQAAA